MGFFNGRPPPTELWLGAAGDPAPTGWVRRRLARPLPPKRRRRSPRPRLLNRTALMSALLAEIASGNSVTRLYALLLAREILAHDPQLAHQYRHQLEAVQE